MASKLNYRYFYTQGQYFNDRIIREYFYFVNDHGEVIAFFTSIIKIKIFQTVFFR